MGPLRPSLYWYGKYSVKARALLRGLDLVVLPAKDGVEIPELKY